MNIKIIRKPIYIFRLAKIIEKISEYIVETFFISLLIDVGRIITFNQVEIQDVWFASRRSFSKDTLSSSRLMFDQHVSVKTMCNFLDNGENK